MVSKGGVPKGRIIPVYLTDEGDSVPYFIYYEDRVELRDYYRGL